MQRPGFTTESRSCYSSGFIKVVCTPSLASNGKTTVSDEQVLKRACMPRVKSVLLQVQLHLAGHVTRMEDISMPEATFFGEL